MRHVVRHDLEPHMARKALRKAWESYAARFRDFNPTATWPNDDEARIGFSAKGMSMNGTLALEGDAIVLEMKVPLLLRAFQGKAIQVIDEEVAHWVGKAKAGEL